MSYSMADRLRASFTKHVSLASIIVVFALIGAMTLSLLAYSAAEWAKPS